jgi:hypothetical protein
MGKKKVATNIPEELLEEATSLTGLNQTQALIAGLKELIAEEKRRRLLDLRGKLHFDLDTSTSRARRKT